MCVPLRRSKVRRYGSGNSSGRVPSSGSWTHQPQSPGVSSRISILRVSPGLRPLDVERAEQVVERVEVEAASARTCRPRAPGRVPPSGCRSARRPPGRSAASAPDRCPTRGGSARGLSRAPCRSPLCPEFSPLASCDGPHVDDSLVLHHQHLGVEVRGGAGVIGDDPQACADRDVGGRDRRARSPAPRTAARRAAPDGPRSTPKPVVSVLRVSAARAFDPESRMSRSGAGREVTVARTESAHRFERDETQRDLRRVVEHVVAGPDLGDPLRGLHGVRGGRAADAAHAGLDSVTRKRIDGLGDRVLFVMGRRHDPAAVPGAVGVTAEREQPVERCVAGLADRSRDGVCGGGARVAFRTGRRRSRPPTGSRSRRRRGGTRRRAPPPPACRPRRPGSGRGAPARAGGQVANRRPAAR